jgi:hypothetical protein
MAAVALVLTQVRQGVAGFGSTLVQSFTPAAPPSPSGAPPHDLPNPELRSFPFLFDAPPLVRHAGVHMVEPWRCGCWQRMEARRRDA